MENIDFEKIKEAVGAKEVILAQSVGSRLYGVNNPRDDDILIVVDQKKDRWKYVIDGKDIFVIAAKEYRNYLMDPGGADPRGNICALMDHEAAKLNIRDSVHYGECEERDIGLFDNKERALRRVIEFGDVNFFHPHIRNKNGKRGCAKMMSWALWYYYAFLNGSLELTAQQQNAVQLCHDGNLPISEAQELRKKIVSLLTL